METFSANLYARMQAELQDVVQNVDNPLKLAEQSYNVVCNYLRELKAFTQDYEFKDKEDEIRFFKEIKPMFLREVIYFMKIFEIESAVPVGKGMQEPYYQDVTKTFHTFFEEHRYLYLYYQTNKDHLDHSMFVRNPEPFPLYPVYSLDEDPHFSNVYSYRLGKIQAFEDILVYIQSRLYAIGSEDGANGKEAKARSPLVFTGTKAQFIEFGYAAQAAQIFNNGKADVKQVMEGLQYYFNIKVTHYYPYFQAMRIRKKNRTPFLNFLIESIVRRMDDSDENPRFH